MVYGLSSKLSRSMTLQLPPILMGFWKCESKLIFLSPLYNVDFKLLLNQK